MGLRILHSIPSINPAVGGPVEGVRQMSTVNAQHGHHIEIVTSDDPNAPWVKEYPFPVHALGPSLLHYGYNPRLVPWLRTHRTRFDVVIVNGIWQYSSFGVWRALHGTPTPYFVFTHGMLDPWFKRQYPLKHIKKWLYWPWADYRTLRDAAAVLFTCEEERRLARQSFWLYKCDEFVVGYGTRPPPSDAEAQRESFLARFPELREKRCLLFLGRVHPKKGPDLLIEALARVQAERAEEVRNEIQLVMAGPDDDAYAHAMKELAARLGIAPKITWTGMLQGDLKWGAFRIADAFVLPSHQENFGIAVAEALGCGVPVLISNQVNIWREIRKAQAGLVETDDLAGTERLLRLWLDTPREEWRLMRSRARECFETRFDIESISHSLITAMELFGVGTSPTRDAPAAAPLLPERV